MVALLEDERYQKVLEMIFGKQDVPDDTVVTSIDQRRFMAAKNHLIAECVTVDAAEANLRRPADGICANTNALIDSHLDLASQLDQEGKWGDSAHVYSELIVSLPDGDDRKARARLCLASLDAKRTDSGQRDDGAKGES